MPSTRSDRLIFANARTRTSQLFERNRVGIRWNLDAEDLRSERDIRLHLRQRQAQIERVFTACQPHRSRQARVEIAILGPPLSAGRRMMDDRNQPPAARLLVVMQVQVVGAFRKETPVVAETLGARCVRGGCAS